jgi:hypothetical protein
MIRSPLARNTGIRPSRKRKPTKMIRSKVVTDSARDQECTLQIANWLCDGPETVVLAHIPLPGNHGTGLKPDDLCAAYACHTCHDLLDGRRKGLEHGSQDWLFYALRGMARTLRIMCDAGIITIKGSK